MFNFIKDKIKKVYSAVTQHIASVFGRGKLDEQFLKELSEILLKADVGVQTTNAIIQQMTAAIQGATVTTIEQAKELLATTLMDILRKPQACALDPRIVIMVGINGSGKTTFIAKYARRLAGQGKKVLLVAGDTFRAAATQQLAEWASRIGVALHVGKEQQDPAAVVFDACKRFKDEQFDVLVIDTAGRLQTKVNLMRELEKIRSIVQRQLPDLQASTWLTIDAMLGQNSLAQAEVFYQATQVNGIVLTKLDGTGKGGIVFAITQKLNLPIIYVTYGEELDALAPFDPQKYVQDLINE